MLNALDIPESIELIMFNDKNIKISATSWLIYLTYKLNNAINSLTYIHCNWIVYEIIIKDTSMAILKW
jgi:hypothetical protein